MNFPGLPAPSTQWLPMPLHGTNRSFWVWYFPANAPQSVAVKLPWDQLIPDGVQVSLHAVLASLQLPLQFVQSVQLAGKVYPTQTDFLLSPQLTGTDGLLSFIIATGNVSPATTQPPHGMQGQAPATQMPAAGNTSGGIVDETVYKRADADWKSTLYLETQAATLRKQLAGTQSRLNSLNKDLPADQKSHASRQDIADWSDARRFLRDASAKLSRYIKEYDIGVTSSAGRRNWMEQTYEQYIRPRQPFDQLDQMQREFEGYRKLLQTLVNNMTSANAFAQQDGEQRAKQVLGRIRSSAKRNKTKDRK